MAVISKGTTFSTGQVSASDLNSLVDAAPFASGAVDNSTTQLSGGAIIVKDGGITPAKLSTGAPSWSAGGTLTATAFSGPITGTLVGSASGSIAEYTLWKSPAETGYPTSGSIPVSFSTSSNALILLAGNTTIAPTAMASGVILRLAMKNNTGGSISMTWPAWTEAGGSFPSTLSAGQAMVATLHCYGTTTASIYAVSSI